MWVNMQQQEEMDFNYSTDAEWDAFDARLKGEQRPEQDWIISDRDVWYVNPYFVGTVGPHPESDPGYDDTETEYSLIIPYSMEEFEAEYYDQWSGNIWPF